jgi:hypothetical protein
MKKLKFAWVLLSLLAMLTSIAAAPMAASVIALIEVRNDRGGGIMFVFRVNGYFSRSELKGIVDVLGEDAMYNLYCAQKDETTVNCTVSRKTAGKHVVVTFGGATFNAFVPETRAPQSSQYCNNVYGWAPPEGGGFGWVLVTLTTHCQDIPANYGDLIFDVYSPYWDSYNEYEFLPSCDHQIADGYYACKN